MIQVIPAKRKLFIAAEDPSEEHTIALIGGEDQIVIKTERAGCPYSTRSGAVRRRRASR